MTPAADRPGLPERLAGPELAVLWQRCWRAMARVGPQGWSTVTVRIALDDDPRRRALSGLLGRPIRAGTAATTVRLHELDRLLRRADEDWDLTAVVEQLHGPLPDRAADARAQADALAAARERARELLPDAAWVAAWLAELDRGMLTRLHTRGELELVVTAARALAELAELAELPVRAVPLPAFATRLTGDPKALGATTLAGLVLRGIARQLGEPVARSAAERRALWEAVGVVPDDLASQVLVLGLRASGSELAGWLTQAAEAGLPFRITLHQLTRQPLHHGAVGAVHVCENPAVLRAAAEQLGAASAPLVCTEGRPSVACLRLLDGLVAAGAEVRVNGDLDWPGLRIAGAVLEATGGRPWRLAAADYLGAIEQPGTRPELSGAPAASPWDPALAAAMARIGRVVYEEDVLGLLVDDLARAGG